jgi:hypothetical protein
MPKFKLKLPPAGEKFTPMKLFEVELLNVDQAPDGRLVLDVRFTVLVPFD